jgi:hypothetical protein
MNRSSPAPGFARCPAPSVQDVLRADGDRDLQIESYRFLGEPAVPVTVLIQEFP